MTARSLLLSAILLAAVSCSAGRRASLGGECELNSDCDAPLVCRIGFCRNECATSADCPTGLSCLLDAQRLGVCQLAEEASCSMPSECRAPLVCRFNQCTNECTEDRDCLGGARCRLDPMGNACIDPSSTPCAFDGECADGEFCLSGRCRQQCFTDRDCRRGWRCNTVDYAGKCEDPAIDAGPRDAGTRDTGGLDADLDAPALDGGGTTCTGPPLDTGVLAISVGRLHACALVAGGRVYCWGMLPGEFAPAVCAREITDAPLPGADAIAAGGTFTCVHIPATGAVHCNGGLLAAGRVFEPLMPPLTPADGLAAGVEHACATSTSGISCWGVNRNGQLGDGTTASATMPRPVTDVVTTFPGPISLGRLHSCAVVGVEGRVDCWGDDSLGQRGEGGGTLLLAASAVAAGGEHTCAIAGGRVYCWGQNSSGQLGDTSPGFRRNRDPVTLPMGVLGALSAGNRHSCVVIDGNGWCWGASEAIDGTVGGLIPTPTMMFTNIRALEAGDDFTCAIEMGGAVVCVGTNDPGTLGDGTMSARYTPAPVRIE